MTPIPTGRLIDTDEGRDLVLTRRFAAAPDDVWASITESDRTAGWFGSWVGEPGAGNTVTVTMTAEESNPAAEVRIDVCEPPHDLAVTMVDETGTWRLEARVRKVDGGAERRGRPRHRTGLGVLPRPARRFHGRRAHAPLRRLLPRPAQPL